MRLMFALASALFMLASPLSVAAQEADLQLEANEIYVPFANGCRRIMGAPAGSGPEAYAYLANDVWDGACVNGVADGEGLTVNTELQFSGSPIVGVRQRYYQGRLSPFLSENVVTSGASIASISRIYAIKTDQGSMSMVVLNGRNGTVEAPVVWSQIPAASETPIESLASASDGVSRSLTYLLTSFCLPENVAEFAPEEQRQARDLCRDGRGRGFHIQVSEYDMAAQQNVTRRYVCDRPATAAGCAATWNRLTAPYHEQWNAVIAGAPAAHAAWLAEREQHRMEAGQRRAEAEQLAAEEARRARAKEDEAQAVKDRVNAEAEARAAEARVREQAAFEERLSALNAGQLFTLADEMLEAGQTDRARAALRALVNRFPDSPLAATAAQQLSTIAARRSGGSA